MQTAQTLYCGALTVIWLVNTKSYVEYNEVIIERMHQKFRIVDHLVQEATRRLPATL